MSGINFMGGTGASNSIVFNFTTTQTVFDYSDAVGAANSAVVSIMGVVNVSMEGLSPMTYNGAGGTLTLSDFANPSVSTLTVTSGAGATTVVSGNGTWETATLNGFDSLVVQGDNANDNTITLASVNPAASNGHFLSNVTLQGGAGNDTINLDTLPAAITATLLGDFAGSDSTNSFNLDEEPAGGHNLFSQILGPVIVSPAGDGGGTSFDTLNLDDSGDTAGRTVLITSTTIDGITGDGTPPAITYDGSGEIAGVNIIGSDFGNTFNIQSTNLSTNPVFVAGATGYVIDTGNGADTVNISSTAPLVNGNGTLNGNLLAIAGPVFLNTEAGTDTLNVSDYTAGAAET